MEPVHLVPRREARRYRLILKAEDHRMLRAGRIMGGLVCALLLFGLWGSGIPHEAAVILAVLSGVGLYAIFREQVIFHLITAERED